MDLKLFISPGFLYCLILMPLSKNKIVYLENDVEKREDADSKEIINATDPRDPEPGPPRKKMHPTCHCRGFYLEWPTIR